MSMTMLNVRLSQTADSGTDFIHISVRHSCHDITWRPCWGSFLYLPCVSSLWGYLPCMSFMSWCHREVSTLYVMYIIYPAECPQSQSPMWLCGLWCHADRVACTSSVCPGGLWAYLWCWKLQPLLVTLTTLRDKLHAHSIPTLTPHCTLTLHHNVSALIIQQCWWL